MMAAIVNAEPLPAPVNLRSGDAQAQLRDEPTSEAQQVTLYPAAALELLQLKCKAVRDWCQGSIIGTTPEVRVRMRHTLSNFEGAVPGRPVQDAASASVNGETVSADPEVLTCAFAKSSGCMSCPAKGCGLPDGSIATTPLDLLTWDCDPKHVPMGAVARSVVTSEFDTDLIAVRDELYAYRDGAFDKVGEDEVGGLIAKHLGRWVTTKLVAEVDKLLRLQHVRKLKVLQPDSNFICFRNGTLNVPERVLRPHSSSHLLVNRIHWDYVPGVPCHGFLRFLDQIWANDADKAEKIRFIRQWMGYCLVADVSMQRMVIFKGHGANGKSVLMDVIRHMVGESNTSSAMLARFRLPHVRSTLEGKLLNQSADLPKTNSDVAGGEMKAVVSGDAIEVSPKFKPSYTIKPYSRLMVATNFLPPSKDGTEGYFRRLVIVEFNRLFEPNERDPQLLDALLREMPGIVAWAVEGLFELRAHGQFSIPASSARVLREYQEEVVPVRLFARECLEHSPDKSGFAARDIYMAFRAWCRDRGFDPGDMISLGRELAAMGFRSRKSGTTVWMIRPKESGEEYFRPGTADLSPPVTNSPPQLPPLPTLNQPSA